MSSTSQNESYTELLGSSSRNYLIDNKGAHVPLTSVGGKGAIVALYFSASWCGPCRSFSPKLIQIYLDCKAKKQPFHVVLISSDKDQQSFDAYFEHMPWYAVPFNDLSSVKDKLSKRYEVRGIPALVLLDGEDASKEITRDGRTAVTFPKNEFPFDKMPELIKNARDKSQQEAKSAESKTSHSLHPHALALDTKYDSATGCDVCRGRIDGAHYKCSQSGCGYETHITCADGKKLDVTAGVILSSTSETDHVVDNTGKSIPLSDLKGKYIIYYFSGHWCPPCRRLTPLLAKAYSALAKAGGTKNSELVFVSVDHDLKSFQGYFAEMPWKAIPYSATVLREKLSAVFSIEGYPSVVCVAPDGRIVAGAQDENFLTTFIKLEDKFDCAAYEKMKDDYDIEFQNWSKSLKSTVADTSIHACALTFVAENYGGRPFGCDVCKQGGQGPAYHCGKCNFDAHVECVPGCKPAPVFG